jgi:hypothetical protein
MTCAFHRATVSKPCETIELVNTEMVSNSQRISEHFRLSFVWSDGGPEDVEIVDVR